MKIISQLNYTIAFLFLFLSLLFITDYLIISFFGPAFTTKWSNSPDNFYAGLDKHLKALPLILIITFGLIILLMIFFKTYLIYFSLIFLFLAITLFFYDPVHFLKNWDPVAEKNITKLLKVNNLLLFNLISETEPDSIALENESLKSNIKIYFENFNLSKPLALGKDNFKSIHKYSVEQGIKVSNPKFLYVTPTVKQILFEKTQNLEFENANLEVKEWSEDLKGLPYLKLIKCVPFHEGGINALGLFLRFKNTDFPATDILFLLPALPKNFVNDDRFVLHENTHLYVDKIFFKSLPYDSKVDSLLSNISFIGNTEISKSKLKTLATFYYNSKF